MAALEGVGGHWSVGKVRPARRRETADAPISVYNVLTSLAEADLALTARRGPGLMLYGQVGKASRGRTWAVCIGSPFGRLGCRDRRRLMIDACCLGPAFWELLFLVGHCGCDHAGGSFTLWIAQPGGWTGWA